jgi:very-short-patch-repair endonuclease
MDGLWIVLLLLFLVVIAIIALTRKQLLTDPNRAWPFYVKRPLSQPEQVLYHRLVKALPEHIVLAQVQVTRVLGIKKGFNFHEWNNRINRLSYDFVVCAKDSTVLAAIELDDGSHNSAKRAETDRKKEQATAAAGVRLIRWHVKSLPDHMAIVSAVAEKRLNPPLHATGTDTPRVEPSLKR